MDNGLFRKESLERISSPEQLHDYLRVTTPRLWMLLGAIVALLIGVIVYASTADMENIAQVRVNLESGVQDGGAEPERMVRGKIPENLKDAVEPGMEVRLGAEKGAVSYVYKEENTMMFIVTMENADLDLPDGEYDAELVLEKAAPISFLWN